MVLPVFPAGITPSLSTSFKKQYKIRIANFGDGYTQRAVDGLNAARETWMVTWEYLDTTDAGLITAFLDARGGAGAFDWYTPHGETRTFSCKKGYSKTFSPSSHVIIAAEFTEEYDL